MCDLGKFHNVSVENGGDDDDSISILKCCHEDKMSKCL